MKVRRAAHRLAFPIGFLCAYLARKSVLPDDTSLWVAIAVTLVVGMPIFIVLRRIGDVTTRQ